MTQVSSPKKLNKALERFRFISIAEGISYLLLLGVAMPLKYSLGIPTPVKIAGWIHGVLFILYIITLLGVRSANKWSFKKVFIAFAASLMPFAPFVFEAKVLRKEK